jgi:hypothetical protein
VILGKLKKLFRGWGASSDKQLKEYRKVVELVRELLYKNYIPILSESNDEQCVMELIGRYYDNPKEFVRVVIPPEPGDVIYFAKKNDKLRRALANVYSDDIAMIGIYTTLDRCIAKVFEAKDPTQKAKFIEGFPKHIESEIIGKGLEEETIG